MNKLSKSQINAPEIDFLMLVGKLKTTDRTGWKRHNIPESESVADHSYRAAMMGMFLAPRYGLDQSKTTLMLLLHDLGEAIIGDVVTDAVAPGYPKRDEKLRAERTALLEILETIDERQYISLYDEFVKNETPEARFAHELDKLEMAIQAREYEVMHNVDLGEFYASARKGVHRDELLKILDALPSYTA